MKKGLAFVLISIFLISFVVALPLTSKAIDNSSGQDKAGNGEQIQAGLTTNQESDVELQNRIRERIQNKLTNEQIEKIFRIKNKIRSQYQNQSECPNNCTCTGSATKCQLANGGREMTVTAGKSGNIIIQVKGINASTNVTLYKSDDGKIYGIFRHNETKRVRMLPNQVQEKIRERFAREFDNETISLDGDKIYRFMAEKKARLFAVFPVKEKVEAEIDPETGKTINVRTSWWGFLARDEKVENIVGASCGTVTPGENNNCCISKGYNLWNSQTNECEFSQE